MASTHTHTSVSLIRQNILTLKKLKTTFFETTNPLDVAYRMYTPVCVFWRGTVIIEEILPEKERPDLGMV